MKLAQLDDNGFFVGVIELDESDINPVERGNYIIPGGCIVNIPGDIPRGSVAAWNGEKYEIISIDNPPEEFRESIETIKVTKEQEIRTSRDYALSVTDWTQLSDIPEEIKIKWSEYRQKLRDVPQQESFPEDVDWPVSPGNVAI